ncbi:hypothetical protein [Pseudomonas monsensis]
MASRFFALFEVIATLLDGILVMSEVTAKKIASVLRDDLAVNAETWCIVDALKRSTLRGCKGIESIVRRIVARWRRSPESREIGQTTNR